MPREIINTGAMPNDKSGDSLYAAFNKVNNNFEELYNVTSGNQADFQQIVQDTIANMFVNGVHYGLNITYDDTANTINIIPDSLSFDCGSAAEVYAPSDFQASGGSAATIYGPSDMLINGGHA